MLFLRLLVHGFNHWHFNVLGDGLHDHSTNSVGVTVRTWSAIFEISLALGVGIPSNTDGRPPVGNTETESIHVCSLKFTSEAELVTLAVGSNVLRVFRSKLVDGLVDRIDSTFVTHLLRRYIGVHTSTVPVTVNDGFGVEGTEHLEVFTDPCENVTGHVKLVTCIDSDAGSDLVFLLARHNLPVSSGNLETCVKACAVETVGDLTTKRVLWSNGAVVRALGAGGGTLFGPAEGCALIHIEEGKLLLHSEPSYQIFLSLESLGGYVTSV
mmetsp:Transcript_26852/g.53628  ORF Transcript_26852/g.53628 Transcript_26852/m.53628 type:complete len:268 (-) Transcript_26852:558-1361(-)